MNTNLDLSDLDNIFKERLIEDFLNLFTKELIISINLKTIVKNGKANALGHLIIHSKYIYLGHPFPASPL
jgi:hypothetical protein